MAKDYGLLFDDSNCPVFIWEKRHDKKKSSKENIISLKEIETNEIKALAYSLYPDAVTVDEKDKKKAVSKTKELVANTNVKVICNGRFQKGDYVTTADIIVRNENNSFTFIQIIPQIPNETFCYEDAIHQAMVMHISDFAYRAFFVRETLIVEKYKFILLSENFNLDMDIKLMFTFYDRTESINKAIERIQTKKEDKKIEVNLSATERPEPTLDFACSECEYLEKCFPEFAKPDSIFFLPRMWVMQFSKLANKGIVSVKDIPEDIAVFRNQELARKSIVQNKLIVSERYSAISDKIVWPIYYLNMKAIKPAIPIYPNTAPYTSIPFQFSIHCKEGPNSEVKHFEYLASSKNDGRIELMDSLISNIGTEGIIFAYDVYVTLNLIGLMHDFPNKKNKLSKIEKRLLDFKRLTWESYDPLYRGDFSVKNIASVLLSNDFFADLEIKDSNTAISNFALMTKGLIDKKEEKSLQENLKKYCERTSLAMVKIHEKLDEVAGLNL